MIKLFNYAGTKLNYVDVINTEINTSNATTYVEPFFGSGAVFFNLEKTFDKYIINDLDKNVITIVNAFKNGDYTLFEACVEEVKERFGDIKNNKEAYYNFRNNFNKYVWNTNTIAEGFYLFLLFNSCLNSMARFGPNGFNQSFGKRLRLLNEEDFNTIKNKLKNTEIYNLDFFDFIQYIPDNSLLFLDPPYFQRQTKNYNMINEKWYNNFIEYCKNSINNILYTDVDHDNLDWNKITIREQMQNISPNRKEEYTIKEVMFKNF
jgi:DNA adenine methylase